MFVNRMVPSKLNSTSPSASTAALKASEFALVKTAPAERVRAEKKRTKNGKTKQVRLFSTPQLGRVPKGEIGGALGEIALPKAASSGK
jgi:hypothetical protein